MIRKQIIIECDNCGKAVLAGSADVSLALLRVLRMGWVATDLIQLCEECVSDNNKTGNDLVRPV